MEDTRVSWAGMGRAEQVRSSRIKSQAEGSFQPNNPSTISAPPILFRPFVADASDGQTRCGGRGRYRLGCPFLGRNPRATGDRAPAAAGTCRSRP